MHGIEYSTWYSSNILDTNTPPIWIQGKQVFVRSKRRLSIPKISYFVWLRNFFLVSVPKIIQYLGLNQLYRLFQIRSAWKEVCDDCKIIKVERGWSVSCLSLKLGSRLKIWDKCLGLKARNLVRSGVSILH